MIHHSVLNALSQAQIDQLHSLYQHEWWTVGRSLADVRTMLQYSDFLFAIAEPETDELLAFARVLTDRVFKALVLDVIVHPDHRSKGLGSFLMAHIMTHPVLSRVRHIELYCLPGAPTFTGATALPLILGSCASCAASINPNRTETLNQSTESMRSPRDSA